MKQYPVDWEERKALALDLLHSGLEAVDPYRAVRHYLRLDDGQLSVGEQTYDLSQFRRVIVVGGGKASAPMAVAVEELLGERIAIGLVNVKYGHTATTSIVEINEAGHPIPDEQGLWGARRIASILAAATADDLVIFLLSGGGSALLALPADGITLADKQQVTGLLLRCGATINEINALRKHLSASKGGQWARLAQPAQVVSLILSDVVGSPLDVIASGPTAPDSSTYTDALWVLEKYGLLEQTPPTALARLRQGKDGLIVETPKPVDSAFRQVQNILIGSNELAARAVLDRASQLGLNRLLLSTYIEGEAREVAKVVVAVAREVLHSGSPVSRPACVVLGGETTVTICGDGQGGRNQELALAAALEAAGLQNVVVASLATDGNDGPTDAAGALVSGDTVARALAMGLEAKQYLAANDSYEFFRQLGDHIITGPTNTNVNDIIMLLVF